MSSHSNNLPTAPLVVGIDEDVLMIGGRWGERLYWVDPNVKTEYKDLLTDNNEGMHLLWRAGQS